MELSNVEVAYYTEGSWQIHWTMEGVTYYAWVDPETQQPRSGVIYRYSGSGRAKPLSAKVHAATFHRVWQYARANNLIPKYHNPPQQWTCGHVATSECAECAAALRRTSNTLIEIIDKLLDKLDQKDTEAERRDLTQALHGPISSALDKPKGTAS